MEETKGRSLEQKRISIPSTIALIIVMALTMFPFYIMLVGAFKPAISLVTFPIDLNPTENMTLKNMVTVLQKSELGLWLKNSFVMSLSVAILTCIVGTTAGYAFAKIDFKGKTLLFSFVMATMMMPKQVLLIPYKNILDI